MILLMFESAMEKSLNSYFACSKLPLILIFPKKRQCDQEGGQYSIFKKLNVKNVSQRD